MKKINEAQFKSLYAVDTQIVDAKDREQAFEKFWATLEDAE